MRRIIIIAAVTVATCSPPPPSPAPVLEAPAAAEELGPSVLCADPTKLVSERGPDGPTVYYCAD
jgi:hypothetical protein